MKQILFTNAKIYDPIQAFLPADSLLVEGNHIGAIGYRKDLLSSQVKEIDLKGKVLLPAFIDTHTHFLELARKKVAVDLEPANSLAEVKQILSRFRENWIEKPEWVRGSGWNINIYPDAQPMDRYFLDKIFPDVPASFESKDFHSKWCNSLALKIADIGSDTPDPPGGTIKHFPDGTPNGMLSEKAWDLIDSAVPPLSRQETLRVAKLTIEDAWRFGFSEIHSMEGKAVFSVFNELADEGIPIRFCWHFPSEILDEMIDSGVRSYTGTDTLKIGGMKIFMDGSLGSQTAYMYDAYPNRPSYFGNMIISADELEKLVERGVMNGIYSSIHAIGDRCLHEVIEVLDKVNQRHGIGKHRIEHLQCIRKEDIPKLIKNKIYCAMQPVHMRTDIPLVEKYWSPDAQRGAYAFATLINQGLEPGFSSDAPVETMNPFQCIYSVLERKHLNDPHNPSWHPSEKIDVTTAIKAYTTWAARASQSQDKRGRIVVGMLADLLVLDDFTKEDNTFWLQCQSHLTMVNGRITYSRS
jgi:predicted amidohydrolase YtcJ